MEIKETGQYLTRGGWVVVVEEILSPGLYAYPVYGYLNNARLMWTRDGKYLEGKPDHEWDLVSKVDLENDAEEVSPTKIQWFHDCLMTAIVSGILTAIAFQIL